MPDQLLEKAIKLLLEAFDINGATGITTDVEVNGVYYHLEFREK